MNIESQVLAELSEDRYSSGQAISRKLNMTRSAVWKHIVKLRERGYVIEASPRHGYRLAGRPDKLLPAELKPLLKTRFVGGRIVHLEETGSTADEARRLIGEKVPEGTVVIAEGQSSGRGRLGRAWQTPPGQAVALSVVLYPSLSPTQVPLLSLATGIAVRNAVESVTGGEASPVVKWPNDVYLNGKKIAGVLVEMAAELDQVKWAIDSVGINVNNSFVDTQLADRATSLAVELGRKFSRRELVAAVLDELERIYLSSRTKAGLETIRRDFERLDLLQGQRIEVATPAGTVEGIAVGIDAEGRLLVREPGGGTSALFSGEATLSGT
ncbi:MAG: biotin--[acetyl-CoA-carboxylase] ligase [Actinobacteria bacterium]|nr:biotin--[acetyl-CoA-carboxylase] ligase [Actinomycetota bacterium]